MPSMEEVYEELDKLKAENEKLRADSKSKTDLLENLKRANNGQREKLQEACLKIDQKEEQLLEKEEQVSVLKQECADIKCKLGEKEAVVKSLSVANDRLRANADERRRTWEEEKGSLAFALDEANEQKLEQERKINALRAELEGVKAHLSASETKCIEVEKKAKNSKELREMDDMLTRFEEQKRKVEDQLKWKKEQFEHLKEAYEKHQNEFRINKKEWEQEKSSLIEEICSLQTNLDSQMRISKDLQNRLEVCNQALAREETRRKFLEVEVSEFRSRYENVFFECEEAKSQLECLSAQRDKEVAALRNSLGTKETFYKELENQNRKLVLENDELKMSLKEFGEAMILEAGSSSSSSSLSKLRHKLKNLEQVHKDCLANHKAREAEWTYRLGKMAEELNDCRSQLGNKEGAVNELEMELECCLSSAVQLRLHNEENSVMLLALQSGFSEAQSYLHTVQVQIGLHDKEEDNNASFLMQQLELKDAALAKAHKDLADECETTKLLSRRIEMLELVEEQKHVMQKELEMYKEMIEESCRQQVKMKEQVSQVESCSKEKIKEVCDALDCAHLELAKEREKVASLLPRIELLDLAEKQQKQMEKELERYKEMLEESCRQQAEMKEQVSKAESCSREKINEVCDALDHAQLELAGEREKVASLLPRIKLLDLAEKQQKQMEKELERYKEMLDDMSKSRCELEKQALLKENESKKKLREVCEALQSAVSELAEEHERAAALTKRVESLEHNEEQWLLMQKEVCDALESAVCELAEEREKASTLAKRVESMDHIEEQRLLMQKEVERYKEIVEASSRHQLQLEKQISNISSDSKRKLREAHDALDRAHSEILDRSCQSHEIEFELWIWRSIAERLKSDLERSNEMRKDIEESLLQQVEDGETIKQEKQTLVHILQQKDSRINSLEEQFSSLERELKTRELAADSSSFEVEKTINELQREKLNLEASITDLRVEKEKLCAVIQTLDCKMNELSSEDARLIGMLGQMMESLGDNASAFVSKSEAIECFDSAKENTHVDSLSSPTVKKLEPITEDRSPFRLLN